MAMSTKDPQVWQMAAGQAGRFYSDLFLEHDVMFLGPGRFGGYSKEVYARAVGVDSIGSGIVSNIAIFHDSVLPGQIVLMREGHHVRSIGVVADAVYQWNDAFDDVYGWDLQHTRRVLWQDHLDEALRTIQKTGPLFGNRKQIPTFTRVNDESVLAPLRPLFEAIKQRNLRPLPDRLPKPFSLDEVGQHLFARGVAKDAADKVIAAIERQRRLLNWYQQYGEVSKRPTEHEVVAHTVLPLLLALGWSEQLLAVEWRKIDLAVFQTTPSTEGSCVLVCEAKTRHHGLQDVRKQAFDYVEDLHLDLCRKVLLTDGGRFYLFQREAATQDWGKNAVGYLNVELIRSNHIAPPNTNAIDTIVALTPAAIGRPLK
jgi:hypothetical protein